MQLKMQTINGTAEVLPINEECLVTGYMGDCVSAIVLAKKGAKNNYEIVRGYHGFGGAENINFNSLFAGLQGEKSILYIFRGTLQRSDYAKSRIQDIVKEYITQHQIIAEVHYFDYSNASVNRTSEITPICY